MPDAAVALHAQSRRRCYVLATSESRATAAALGLLEPGGLARLLARAEPGARGRAASARVALAAASLHLRPLRHGGILAGLLRDRWLSLRRPRAELAVAVRLAGA